MADNPNSPSGGPAGSGGEYEGLNEAAATGAKAAAGSAGFVDPASQAVVGKAAELGSSIATDQASEVPGAGKAMEMGNQAATAATSAIPKGPGLDGGDDGKSVSESAAGGSIQEEAQAAQNKFTKAAAVAGFISQHIAAWIIIALVVVLLMVLAGASKGVFQTLGRNSNACVNGEDCAVDKKVDDCAVGTSPDGTGQTSWPANAAPGTKAAIRAVYDLLLAGGFSADAAYEMTILAGPESTWNPRAGNGSYRGLFQIGLDKINTYKLGNDLYDPVTNIKYAKKLYDNRKFADWQAHPSATALHAPHYANAPTTAQVQANWERNKALVREALGPGGSDSSTGSSGECSNSSGAWTGATCGDDCTKVLKKAEQALGDCSGVLPNGASYGGSGWHNECLAFTQLISDWAGVPTGCRGLGTAAAAHACVERSGKGNVITDWNTVPAGAIILRKGGTYGHAMIAAGGGMVITTYTSGTPNGECVYKVPGSATQGGFPISNFLWVAPSAMG